MDVYGEGVLITGESGIGKSEAALELIKRGHRLVTDDVVEIRKVSDDTLIGTAPDITKHFIELRGIGIVDVKTLFGVSSVKDTQNIDLVIRLEDWDKDKEYDRLGLKKSIRNIWAIRSYATISRFVRDVILRSYVSPRRSTTVRRRWDITRRRNCTPVCRIRWQGAGMRKIKESERKAGRNDG